MAEYAHLHVRIDLNASLMPVTDACQHIHTAAVTAAENEQQMVLAAKLLGQDRICAEFMGTARDQLMTMGYDDVYDRGYVAFNVLRSGRFASAVQEKGQRERLRNYEPLPTPGALSPAARAEAENLDPLYGKSPPTRVCSRSDLLGPDTDASLERTCTSWFIPEILPNHPDYAPQSPVARDYSLWLVSKDPEVLRQSYREMKKWGKSDRLTRSALDPFRFAPPEPFRFRASQSIILGPVRPKRQVMMGALALGGVVLLSQWESIMEHLGFGSSTTKSTVRAVNEDTRHIRIIEDQVQSLSTLTLSIRDSLGYTKKYERIEDEYDQVVALRSEVFGQYSRLFSGIEQLRNSHRLNSALIHPPYVNDALTKLSADLRKDFKDLLFEDKNDIYQLETSYVMLPNFTLEVFVHIPVGDHSKKLRLYEFVPAPIRLSDHPQLFQVEPYRIHLAVGKTRQDEYKELSGKDLTACRVLQHFYYCPHQAVIGFDHEKSCLSGLYWNEDEVVRQSCPLKPIPHDDYFVQLNPSDFVLALDKKEMFRFYCDGEDKGVLALEGILKLSIPPGCMVEGNTFTLKPTHELHYKVGEILTRPLVSAKSVLSEMIDFATNSSSLYNIKSGNIGPSLAEVSDNWVDHIVKENNEWTFKQYMKAGLATVVGVIVLLIGLKCFLVWKTSANYSVTQQSISGLTAQLGQAEERMAQRFTLSELARREERLEEVDQRQSGTPSVTQNPAVLDDISEEGYDETSFSEPEIPSFASGLRSVTQSLPGFPVVQARLTPDV